MPLRSSRLFFTALSRAGLQTIPKGLTRPFSNMSKLPTDTRPIVVSGPSGVGKGTLLQLLFSRHPDVFAFSVSHTTRDPRSGEVHGVHYHFVPMKDFEDLIDANGFVEHAKFSGNRYGTSKMTIEEQSAKGKVVVLDIEMEGVKQIKNSDIPARYVFVAPPSEEILEKRLRGRGTETEESVQKRLTQAKRELEYSKTPGVHDIIIVNDDLETAYKQLDDFIYKSA
ncbi:Guanylate kinase [Scedosporium apiospermum]|uniref:Guanylate kinase n=1 Tax=Pseudallescheria apiosperma TaxID=563466 RepID=A0A084GFI5_PSEDA|nr:Guanylate kinase [Scedosporium apiospermum]KEZ46097.1 Guanylate kinase [Scedosporium apiospermum]